MLSGHFLASTEALGPVGWWVPIFWMAIVCVVILGFGRLAIAGETERAPKSVITRVAEHAYLFIENMCLGVIGPHGKRYIPLVFTVYAIVLTSNAMGLFGMFAPTSSLGITFGMAVIVVVYVQIEGIKANGLVGYIKHFFGPPLGPWLLPITLLLFVIEVISESAKLLSLSLRLQGNISGEHRVAETLGNLWNINGFSVPLQTVLLPLSLFVVLVQALVFTILTCVYLSLFTSHDEEHAQAH